jgi:hypothetical protein
MKSVANFRFKQAELGNFTDVSETLRNFGRGCRILGLTNGSFSLIDLIHGLLKKTGKAHVTVVTWSAGIKDAHNVKWMADSDLLESFTIVTDHSFTTRQKKYAASITELFGAANIRTSEIHAKFVLIENDSYKICLRTSMNLNANRTCESFEIDEDREIFNFYKNFVDHTFATTQQGFIGFSEPATKSVNAYFRKLETNNESSRQWWSNE